MRTILHIEPSEVVSIIVENIVKDNGCEYIYTNSYSEALIIIEEHEIDMILLSLVGDGMSIEEFVKNIEYISSEVPICIVSSNKFDKTIKGLMNLGVREYIDKHNLESEVSNYIENHFINDKYMENVKDTKIVVVDDCPFSRMNLKEIFKKYGLKNIKYYSSGFELEKSNEKFDVYLIDIFLKDEFGKNIISKIREENKSNSLILAVTAVENSEILAEIIDIGADDIIKKPIEENLFMAKLKSYSKKLFKDI